MSRPRSEAVRRAVFDAALALLREDGFGALTMEGIARRAGASKQTLYRWWESPAAVVLEATVELAAALVPDQDTGSLATDLGAFVRRSVAGLAEAGPVMSGLMAKAQLHEAFGEAFRRQFLARRRAALRLLLVRGRGRGEVAAEADLDLLVDLMFGALWYRLLAGHAPLDGSFADGLADALLRLASASHGRPQREAGRR